MLLSAPIPKAMVNMPVSFAQPVRLGKNGVEEYLPIGQLSDFEKQSLNGMLDVLKKRYNSWRRIY